MASHPDPIIDLSANENPLGPSPRALAAVTEALQGLHRYPSKDGDPLRDRLAQQLDLSRDHLLLGNGATELLEFAARAALGPPCEAIVAVPCFMPYQKVVQRAGARLVKVLALPGEDPLPGVLAAVGSATRMVILGNPNNPTGGFFTQAQLDRFLARLPRRVLLVLDEAYGDYVEAPDFPDAVAAIRRHRNLLVLRSLSKAHGLAGLRLGYAFGDPALIRTLDAERQHYNTNTLAQAAALAAVDDDGHLRKTVANNSEGRGLLARGFDALGLEQLPSQANFILVQVGDGAAITAALAGRGIRVKPMDRFGLPAHIRVSIGLPRENQALIRALGELLAAPVCNPFSTPFPTTVAANG